MLEWDIFLENLFLNSKALKAFIIVSAINPRNNRIADNTMGVSTPYNDVPSELLTVLNSLAV